MKLAGFLISQGIFSLRGKRIGLDCANGSSWNIAKSVFDALGAKTYVINAEPDGYNINKNAVSLDVPLTADAAIGKTWYDAKG